MKFLAGSTIVAIAFFGVQAFAQAGSDIAGTWLTEDGRAKIRTEHCGEGSQKLCGYVVWMKDPLDDKGLPRTDIKNPDPSKRARPSLGLELMTGLKPEDRTHFSGEIYNAEDGKMYSVSLSLEKADELDVRGCLMHFLCATQAWSRVADIALPGATKVASTPTSGKPAKPSTVKPHDKPPPSGE